MGDGMARNLIKGGRDVVVWNRTGSKADDFSKQTGCQTAGTPREVSACVHVGVVETQRSFLRVLRCSNRNRVKLTHVTYAEVWCYGLFHPSAER